MENPHYENKIKATKGYIKSYQPTLPDKWATVLDELSITAPTYRILFCRSFQKYCFPLIR